MNINYNSKIVKISVIIPALIALFLTGYDIQGISVMLFGLGAIQMVYYWALIFGNSKEQTHPAAIREEFINIVEALHEPISKIIMIENGLVDKTITQTDADDLMPNSEDLMKDFISKEARLDEKYKKRVEELRKKYKKRIDELKKNELIRELAGI